MKIAAHADRTEKLCGVRAEDIHKWIDGFFDTESFGHFLRSGGNAKEFNPYNHRKYRHCAEALEDAYKAFEGQYTREEIKAVFEQHIRDDYDDFIPLQEDFERGTFTEKYHEGDGVVPKEKILSEAELSQYFQGKAHATEQASSEKLSARFHWRIVLPTVIAAVLFAVSTFTIIIPVFRASMMEQKKQMLKELASTAVSVIDSYRKQEESGAVTREQAQSLAASQIRQLRYGIDNKDYFWITDMHPRMVMHPYRPELVGQDLRDYTDSKDKSGKHLFVELADLVKADNHGYLEYQWQWMDDATRSEPKLSYVTGVIDWNWVVGTGVYIHDVENEISTLSNNLLIADGVIAALLLGLLANIVYQSRKIELHRKHAEVGLREAKDRYRALVESSNEGYILEVGGETIYTNHTLQRMAGYAESELASMDPWDLLDPEEESNRPVREHLQATYQNAASSGEYEARLHTKSGDTLDLLIVTSRLFFPEKNGHLITFRQLIRGEQHTLQAFNRLSPNSPSSTANLRYSLAEQALHAPDTEGFFESLQESLCSCNSSGKVIQSLQQLPLLVRNLSEQGIRPSILREVVGRVYDTAIHRFIELALEESPPRNAGSAPLPSFAFLSLGSNARHEMTLFSDQDNALVFADVDDASLSAVRIRFLKFTDEICATLKQAGYPYCPGGIMSANPKWCLSLSEWKCLFHDWIHASTPESLLEMHVFLDTRCSYGDDTLLRELREFVDTSTAQHPPFFLHFARNCLGYQLPLSLLGHLRTKKHGDHATINLKECLRPLETFARIYAVKHGIHTPGTLDRLHALHEADVILDETYHEFLYLFDHLWRLRFYNQIQTNAALNPESDALDVGSMTEVERDHLQAVISRIPGLQTKLSYDFLGVASS